MMRGEKWLREASYLSDADREKVRQEVARCRAANPNCRVGVRPPSYIGEPAPIATVIYGHGDLIWASVYRDR